MTIFHLELSAQAIDMTARVLDHAFDLIADALYDCVGIENADLSSDSSSQIVTFSMDVEGATAPDALIFGLGIVRTSLHASGGATPGWEKHFTLRTQTIEPQQSPAFV